MQAKKILMWVIVVLLIFINFLTFHDAFEQHTFRDWLTLLTSVLVIVYFFKAYKK